MISPQVLVRGNKLNPIENIHSIIKYRVLIFQENSLLTSEGTHTVTARLILITQTPKAQTMD